ncbi:hypothetical protein CROQUDRAFT_58459 [Cronartium quercuum f. sp. fusiforme G11]|uniref:PUB domain-containing protein n=1 Tax=Cronartium quercuum f. sp. fusiforme G11 TaxID=708437 RepID=A0A9P6TGY2_9BASI|nr:hypothetical protein CROQUDRAFT_58459 [Cronartium quercuum f. sp. fusiforme G11]
MSVDDQWNSEAKRHRLMSPTSITSVAEQDMEVDVADKARAAAEARRNTVSSPPSSSNFDHDTRQNFLHLIERQLLERNTKAVVLTALETLEKITFNVLKNPSEAKFKSVKHSNSLIKKNIIDVPGAREYLLACKFAPGVKEHVEVLNFPTRPTERQLAILNTGHVILRKKIEDIKKMHETQISMKQKEADAENSRKASALLKIRDDRERQKVRATRERMARMAMERQAQIEPN